MAQTQKANRTYDSSRRRRQAEINRRRVLDVARELFVEHGYAGTTLAAVAAAADVGLPTVYAAFGSKRGILAELLTDMGPSVDVSLGLLDDARMARLVAIGDVRDKVRAFAGYVLDAWASTADLLTALRAAASADEDADQLEAQLQARRYGEARWFAAHLGSLGVLRDGVTVDLAAETLWLLSDVQTFHLLLKQRAWSPAKFKRWFARLVADALLTA
jgi:AcrR family transcriptional regulator